MNVEYHRWYSQHIGRDMELKIYGHAGLPFMIFPCSKGRFWDFADRGMIDTIKHHIEAGRIICFCVDGLDWETWHNYHDHPSVGARRHQDYDKYIVHEVAPFVKWRVGHNDRIIAIGSSMGAYHAMNFFLRHPDIFGGTIAMSGVYHMREFFGSYMDDNVYYNSPLAYLGSTSDNWFLENYRSARTLVSVGQGAFEDVMIRDTRELQYLFNVKSIPGAFEYWGHDVNHDWPWWVKQFPVFTDKILSWWG